MKNKYLIIPLGLVLVVSAMFIFAFGPVDYTKRSYQPIGTDNENSYSIRGAIEYMTNIKANQITKTIEVSDVIKAQEQAKRLASSKTAGQPWNFRGPDNFGGRTRAILFDNENANLMYAGGVSGGLWRSTTKGQYWEQVRYNGATVDDFANLAVVSITQDSDGVIYFGTGEAIPGWFGHGTNIATPLSLGAGMWKSDNRGQSFTRVESTWGEDKETFAYVNKLGVDLNNNKVYAATGKGLRESTNGGDSWSTSSLDNSEFESQFASDVKVASDGSVIASIGNRCFVKKAGASEFKYRSGDDEHVVDSVSGEKGNLISDEDIGRLEFAYSKKDPNIVVCAAATESGQLRNIYRSTDGGDNWLVIGAGGSDLFQPFGHQGIYDMCIEISASSDDEIFIAGFDVWFGKAANTGNLFAWSQASLNQLSPISSLFVHADQHTIVFDPSDPKMFFVGSDGGMSRCYLDKDGSKYQFTRMNKNYNVTQFYSVAVNSRGQLLGGTQDNGSILVPNTPDFLKKGYEIYNNDGIRGDGGHAIMSSIMPNIAFSTTQFGGLWRNNDANFSDWNTFYSAKIINLHWAGSSTYQINQQPREGSFVTPIAYYETDNDVNSIDTVEYITLRNYSNGEKVSLPSHNINKAPIHVTLDQDYAEGDTIRYRDHYGSLFAYGMARTLWITRSATNWNKTLTDRDWFRSVKRGVLDYTSDPNNMEYISQLAFSADGASLFFSTSYNKLYRLSGLDTARTEDQVDWYNLANLDPITSLKQIGVFENRTITGISCDPNNIENILVTIGNYGNEDYVYYCDSASTVGKTLDMSNFVDVTGNLPTAPAYCTLFELSTANDAVLIGTDMGVFKTDNITTENVTWYSYQDSLGPVPTFQITQQTKNWRWTENNGMIYIGTHGLGMFENKSFLSGIEEEKEGGSFANNVLKANVYPNPVQEELNISFELESQSDVIVEVMNISGQVFQKEILSGARVGVNSATINLGSLTKGMYLVRIKANGSEVTKQIVKQ